MNAPSAEPRPHPRPDPIGRPSEPAFSARRVIVKEVNWLGDIVMSLPALRAIRRAWPRAHLAVLVRRELAGFFDGAEWIDEVLPYSIRHGLGGIGDRRRTIAALRVRRFDLGVVFPNSFSSALWIALAGVPRRAGFATQARGALLNLRAPRPANPLSGHQVHYWIAMIHGTLGIEGDPADVALEVHPPHLKTMEQWIGERRRRANGPLVALAPAAAYGPAKQWPAENWARLIDLLAERIDGECVLVGGPGERALCREIEAASGAGAIVAAGETSIGEIIALLSLSAAFAGNDSGPMHLAGALGIPTVAIFGSTNPARTGPLGPRCRVLYHALECSPCLDRTCRFGHYNCLRTITAEEAAGAITNLAGLVRPGG